MCDKLKTLYCTKFIKKTITDIFTGCCLLFVFPKKEEWGLFPSRVSIDRLTVGGKYSDPLLKRTTRSF